jgi:ABC-type polysaccharide transport system permease subunit
MTAQQQPSRPRAVQRSFFKSLLKHWHLYLMALPAIVAILVFGYGPLFGLAIAFQKFSPFRGISGSDWIGFENFRDAFANPFFWTAFRNSLVISALKLAIGFPTAIILALLLNEVRLRWFKSLVQTASILPFFISWVVAGTMFRAFLAPDGLVNEVRQVLLGLDSVLILSDPLRFLWTIVLQDTWKYAGYFAVLYLAAIAAIDTSLYEAAEVDGASRWQQTRFITLPGISNTMITLFIVLVGYLVSAGFEQIYVMYGVAVYSTADILETFTLRLGLRQSNYGLATAVGLFQGVISLSLVLVANFIARRVRREGLF